MHEYEVNIHGVKHTMVLSDEDAKDENRYPGAKRVGGGDVEDKAVKAPAKKVAPKPAEK